MRRLPKAVYARATRVACSIFSRPVLNRARFFKRLYSSAWSERRLAMPDTRVQIPLETPVVSVPDAMVSVPLLHGGCWGFESLGADHPVPISSTARARASHARHGVSTTSSATISTEMESK